ncbi:prepilin peptidase [Microlunatus parietis]|uniref:Leader peptidase (Prepilin peptidase)/N-methyltransferase n=1 Tax=Microlunatus parietis TaxID=682979 RepID=A0A7Y9IET3_9ACTN|nr:A24 family peptidase [Microlunatus parietis]NYE74899.1 leader peptidase (prepilin peptidase)/N-methyltransferase [Microlunatus parietis]
MDLWSALAVALVLSVAAALWLRRRGYRYPDDEVRRTLNPWLLPVVAVAGVLLASLLWRHPLAVTITYTVALVWALVLALIDLEVRRLPDLLTLPGYPVFAAGLITCSALAGSWRNLAIAGIAAAVALVVFLLLALFSPGGDGLGFGDVKLAGVLGGLLGWLGPTTAMLGLLTGFVLGGIVAVILIVSRRADRRSHLSFGPAMIVGAYLWAILPPV